MLGIIGGSGLSEFAELEVIEERQLSNDYGAPSAPFIIGKLAGREVAFLARHGRPHLLAPHEINYRANLQAFSMLGVKQIIAVNAVGGISDAQDAMQLSLPEQLIDYSYGREQTFANSFATELLHIDFTYPFAEPLRQQLIQAAKILQLPLLAHAVIAVTQGPRLETAAEIRRFAQDGCDIVGMTSMPEAALARELGIDYAAIALVVNKAAGCSDGLITWPEIEANMQQGIAAVRSLLLQFCRQQ